MPPLPTNCRNAQFLNTVANTIGQYDMLSPGGCVLVAVSGGPDSMALLYSLLLLAPRYKLTLAIGHLNHSLRSAASDKDARFVENLGIKLNLPVFSHKMDVAAYGRTRRLSLEDAGRQCRYTFFKETAARQGYQKIALGHQADDNAEQVLMHLLRGSGPLGMAGIPPSRPDGIIRPLIQMRRNAIISFLKINGIAHRTDLSNLDQHFTRNRVRHTLMPLLAGEFNPNVTAALNRFATIARDEEKWIMDLIGPLYAEALISATPHGRILSPSKLQELDPAPRRRIIRRAIEDLTGSIRGISWTHVEAVTAILSRGSLDKGIDLPQGLRITLSSDGLVVEQSPDGHKRGQRPPPIGFCYTVDKPGNHFVQLFIRESGARLKFREVSLEEIGTMHIPGHRVAFFDMDGITFPLTVRSFQPGDRFRPLGLGGTQKVKKFFINGKVPKSERGKIPLVFSADRLVWVAGYRIDDGVKLTPQTKRVLRAEICLA